MRLNRTYCVLFLLLLVSCGPWERANEFVAGLRCGMTVDELRRYTQKYEGAKLIEEKFAGAAPLVVTHSNTAIELWTRDGHLVAAQVTWHDGRPTEIARRPQIDVCGDKDTSTTRKLQ